MSVHRLPCRTCPHPGALVFIDHRGVERYDEHLIAESDRAQPCAGGSQPTGRDTVRCKHCEEWLVDLGQPALGQRAWTHATGEQRGKTTCALDPYGYQGEPVDTPCGRTCRARWGES